MSASNTSGDAILETIIVEAGAHAQKPVSDRSEATTRISTGSTAERPREIGGRDGPEPTRYGDWEKAGRCIDF